MSKKRLYSGVVDLITIIGVLFLVISLGIGTYVVADKQFNFNILERAAILECFPAGTKISLNNGQLKNIEEFEVGDEVISEDENGIKTKSTTTKLYKLWSFDMCNIEFESSETLELTGPHPLFTKEGWKAINVKSSKKHNPDLEISEINEGDYVKKQDGGWDKVTSISCRYGLFRVYNLAVDNTNSYFAKGYLSHNKSGGSGVINRPDRVIIYDEEEDEIIEERPAPAPQPPAPVPQPAPVPPVPVSTATPATGGSCTNLCLQNATPDECGCNENIPAGVILPPSGQTGSNSSTYNDGIIGNDYVGTVSNNSPSNQTGTNSCSVDGGSYSSGAVVVYSSGANDYKICTDHGWDSNACIKPDGSIGKCLITDLNTNIPDYLASTHQQAVQEQERLQRLEQSQLETSIRVCYQGGGTWIGNACVDSVQTFVTVERDEEGTTRDLVAIYRDQTNTAIGSTVTPITINTRQSLVNTGEDFNVNVTREIINANTNELINSFTQRIAPQTATNPVHNFAYCNNEGSTPDQIAQCNQRLNQIYNLPLIGNYIQSYSNENTVTPAWNLAGYDSLYLCQQDMLGRGGPMAAQSCNTYQPTREQLSSSVQLGPAITAAGALIASPLGWAGGALTGTQAIALGFAGIQTFQTGTTASTCITEGYSSNCSTQFGWTLLGYANFGSSALQTLYNGARWATNLNTGINIANVGFDIFDITQSCGDGEYASGFGCGAAIVGTVFDVGQGVSDIARAVGDINLSLGGLSGDLGAMPDITYNNQVSNFVNNINPQTALDNSTSDLAVALSLSPHQPTSFSGVDNVTNGYSPASQTNTIADLEANLLPDNSPITPDQTLLTTPLAPRPSNAIDDLAKALLFAPNSPAFSSASPFEFGGGQFSINLQPLTNFIDNVSVRLGNILLDNLIPTRLDDGANPLHNSVVFEQDVPLNSTDFNLGGVDVETFDPQIRVRYQGRTYPADTINDAEEIARRLTGRNIEVDSNIKEPSELINNVNRNTPNKIANGIIPLVISPRQTILEKLVATPITTVVRNLWENKVAIPFEDNIHIPMREILIDIGFINPYSRSKLVLSDFKLIIIDELPASIPLETIDAIKHANRHGIDVYTLPNHKIGRTDIDIEGTAGLVGGMARRPNNHSITINEMFLDKPHASRIIYHESAGHIIGMQLPKDGLSGSNLKAIRILNELLAQRSASLMLTKAGVKPFKRGLGFENIDSLIKVYTRLTGKSPYIILDPIINLYYKPEIEADTLEEIIRLLKYRSADIAGAANSSFENQEKIILTLKKYGIDTTNMSESEVSTITTLLGDRLNEVLDNSILNLDTPVTVEMTGISLEPLVVSPRQTILTRIGNFIFAPIQRTFGDAVDFITARVGPGGAPNKNPFGNEIALKTDVDVTINQRPSENLAIGITGIEIGNANMTPRLTDDHYILKQKYGLPDRGLRFESPSEYITQLNKIASDNDIAIRDSSEWESFFQNHPAGAVFDDVNNQIFVDFRTAIDDPITYSGLLEHELIHALQTKRYPGMPVEVMEYEAYITANMSLTNVKLDPKNVQETLFSNIGYSVNHWYQEKNLSNPWLEVRQNNPEIIAESQPNWFQQNIYSPSDGLLPAVKNWWSESSINPANWGFGRSPQDNPIEVDQPNFSKNEEINKLVSYIVGPEIKNTDQLVTKMKIDQQNIINEYELPPFKTRFENPQQYLDELLEVARRNGIEIDVDPNRTVISQDKGVLYLKTITSTNDRDLKNLVHELTHALDYKNKLELSIEELEYRAYISELGDAESVYRATSDIFVNQVFGGFGVRYSVEKHYNDLGITEYPWNKDSINTQTNESVDLSKPNNLTDQEINTVIKESPLYIGEVEAKQVMNFLQKNNKGASFHDIGGSYRSYQVNYQGKNYRVMIPDYKSSPFVPSSISGQRQLIRAGLADNLIPTTFIEVDGQTIGVQKYVGDMRRELSKDSESIMEDFLLDKGLSAVLFSKIATFDESGKIVFYNTNLIFSIEDAAKFIRSNPEDSEVYVDIVQKYKRLKPLNNIANIIGWVFDNNVHIDPLEKAALTQVDLSSTPPITQPKEIGFFEQLRNLFKKVEVDNKVEASHLNNLIPPRVRQDIIDGYSIGNKLPTLVYDKNRFWSLTTEMAELKLPAEAVKDLQLRLAVAANKANENLLPQFKDSDFAYVDLGDDRGSSIAKIRDMILNDAERIIRQVYIDYKIDVPEEIRLGDYFYFFVSAEAEGPFIFRAEEDNTYVQQAYPGKQVVVGSSGSKAGLNVPDSLKGNDYLPIISFIEPPKFPDLPDFDYISPPQPVNFIRYNLKNKNLDITGMVMSLSEAESYKVINDDLNSTLSDVISDSIIDGIKFETFFTPVEWKGILPPSQYNLLTDFASDTNQEIQNIVRFTIKDAFVVSVDGSPYGDMIKTLRQDFPDDPEMQLGLGDIFSHWFEDAVTLFKDDDLALGKFGGDGLEFVGKGNVSKRVVAKFVKFGDSLNNNFQEAASGKYGPRAEKTALYLNNIFEKKIYVKVGMDITDVDFTFIKGGKYTPILFKSVNDVDALAKNAKKYREETGNTDTLIAVSDRILEIFTTSELRNVGVNISNRDKYQFLEQIETNSINKVLAFFEDIIRFIGITKLVKLVS